MLPPLDVGWADGARSRSGENASDLLAAWTAVVFR